ncbi:MAG: AAA family ATPase [Oscillospiraceae bacterium]|nr:AAA family ATPase [Oscillospiraceae bacterium]
MKTINFYSYKGGVGRTLLLSQTARCLAALGKKVVIADFDFDAPGIPLNFGVDICEVEGGLYNLIYDEVYPSDNESPEERNFNERLSSYLKPVKEIYGKGSVHILPSGCVSLGYWNNIFRVKWLRLLSSKSSEESKSLFVQIVNDNLKPALIDMGIDYFLIDSRAGITYYSEIAREIADVEAVVFCPNIEAIFSLRNWLLPLITANITNKRVELEEPITSRKDNVSEVESESLYVFVASRMPPELPDKKKDKLLEIKRLIKSQLESDIFESTTLLTFDSDMETQLDPNIRSMDERYKNEATPKVLFHEEVLMILASLCPEVCVGLCTNISESDKYIKLRKQAHALWKSIYGYDFSITYENRLFSFFIGEMFNPDDENRNIAFKVETFLNFLSDFHKTLAEDLFEKDLNKAKPIMDRALFNAGERCGAAFGTSLATELNSKKRFGSDEKNIKIWCEFDTRAGFGKMTYGEGSVLSVENLFLLNPSGDKVQDYTEFFKGYTIGVLENLLGKKVKNELKNTGDGNTVKYKIVLEERVAVPNAN